VEIVCGKIRLSATEERMAGINVGRVIGGGLLAGLVMNVVDGVTNGAILGAR
jgi:hypothetical protein